MIRLFSSIGLLAALLTPTMQLPAGAAARPAADGDLIALTDQKYDNLPAARIRVMDPAVYDWNTAAAQTWSWSPTAANGFSDLTSAWGLPSDAKLRTKSGSSVAVVADSRGLAALISYPAGQRIWGVNVGAANNPHSVEMLPNGNVAVAASAGGFIRLYNASQGSNSAGYASYPLTDAHGVQWDPTRNVLWALGGDQLVALTVGGTAAAPTLTKANSITLPTGGGHDLTPVLANHDRLWVSTGSMVYQVSKSSRTVVATYSQGGIKSISSKTNGQEVRTSPKSGCRTTWCTDTVNFASPAATRTLTGAEIYKARVWSSHYE